MLSPVDLAATRYAKIESLTAFRFLAALIVVFFHYGRSVTGGVGMLSAGPQMVTFFFVLSGLVMYLAHHDDHTPALRYWKARIARIAPVYMLALVAAAVATVVSSNNMSGVALFFSATFLQAWIPPYPLTINPPGWSISVEAFFYLLFPALLFFAKKEEMSAKKLFAISFGLWGGTQITLSILLSNGFYTGFPSFSHDFIYFSPLFHLCSFILGIAGGRWLIARKKEVLSPWHGFLLFGLALSFSVLVLDNLHWFDRFFGVPMAIGTSLLAPLFLALILSVALVDARVKWLLGSAPLVLLGEASYALYIFQEPVYMMFVHFMPTGLLDKNGMFYAYLCLLTGLSILIHLKFERPAKTGLLRVMGGKRNSSL